ncbi:hypothetical protein NP233_g11861 [Leucocoprinus birnbaumii]|uniref:HMG domain-containing protein n=1 Tax=Leucocoprinus birnbaumii TaxID=56174 RepID=A0AAD5YNK1_9AGAR|nr:hypothetical protein NP233_g11861 [Leucocoprinus birnbaumii]
MSKPGHRLLKNLAGDNGSLQKYPRLPPPRDLETPASIYSNKKRNLVDITSPTKRTRASDIKPRTKRSKPDTQANSPLEKDATERRITGHPIGFELAPPEVDFEFSAPEETPVLQSSHSSSVHPWSFAEYLDAVNGGCAGYSQIARGLCVVQGWDVKRSQTTSQWYHLQFIDVNGLLRIACQCPIEDCFHKRYLREYHDERFISLEMKYPSEVPLALFYCERIVGDMHKSIFSVTTNSSSTPMNRALVVYEGLDTGEGRWTCSKDSREQIRRSGFCSHIKLSRSELARRFGIGPEGLNDGPIQTVEGESVVRKIDEEWAVSYLPVLPPIWAELPTDSKLYPRVQSIRQLDNGHVFRLTSTSTCSCGGTDRSYFDPSRPIIMGNATLYTLIGSFTCRIELQTCPKCPSSRTKHIGPDLRELGVFNYNNSRLLTHELLDDYTNVFSSSETPFDAWCEIVMNRYSYTPGNTFMSKDSFRACWFAYARLQNFEGDFQCPDCGPHPETVVWDGVSLSFSLSKLSGSLEPPTKTSSSSPIRPHVRYFPKQQLIPEAGLRRRLRKALAMESLSKVAENASTASSPQKPNAHAKQSQQVVNVVSDHMDNVVLVTEELKHHNESLGDLFHRYWGITAYHNGSKVPKAVASFVKQIAAEESVLQMVNREGLRALDSFLSSPKPATASGLITIPHLYLLLEWGYERKVGYQPLTISIATWIRDRAQDVLDTLLKNSTAPVLLEVTEPINTNWELTGCFYSMPKIRERPTYPLLIHDKQKDDTQKESREQSDGASPPCGKYYSTYKERRLTGGIMVAWCPHSISYGYHCMPGCEGRNDVFSAMITRWPRAPKRVVYDFSCALGPYCLLREPDFFADTLFIIDNFHARDHTKCANACFASTYAKLDPELSEVNTSAAECGNSLILRIRKSVSYMSERRAIIYTKVFLSIINRKKINQRLRATHILTQGTAAELIHR